MSALITVARPVRAVGRAVAGRGGRVDAWLSPGRRRVAVTAVLIALLVVASAAAVVLFLGARERSAIEAARVDGLRAASDLTTRLLSYDYRTLDANLAAADGATTGAFADQYRNLAAQLIRPNATEQQIVTTAAVVGNSVVTATPDGVVALLYLNQSTTGKDRPAPRIDRSRARVSMTLVDGNWRISDIVPV